MSDGARRADRHADEPPSIRPAAVLALAPADPPDEDGLRFPLAIPVAGRVTTLVGPNAAGKSNVLRAVAGHLAEQARHAVVLHVPAGTRPVDLARTVARSAQVADLRGEPTGRTADFDAAVEDLFLDEARRVVPEVSRVDVDLDAGILVARDRHGMAFSVSAGLRASLALALARVLVDQGRAVGGVLIEEPGAFLHPAAQEALRERLQSVASMVDAPVVVTSETPFAIPRGPDDLVVALARDEAGHPVVVGEAPGDDPHAGVIGGLFRDPGLGAVLDRAARLVPGTRAVLVFEGGTDEAYLRIAADVLGRADELEGVSIVPAGGASTAALQAVVLRAETDLPLLVVLDNDDPGRTARDTLVRRLGFEKRREVTTYAEVLPGYPPGTEAEDMFAPSFVARFVEELGPDAISGKRVLHGKPDGPDVAWHFDLTSSAKSAFVRWARKHAQPGDVPGWAKILDVLAERLG